jgi:hypothetical protein
VAIVAGNVEADRIVDVIFNAILLPNPDRLTVYLSFIRVQAREGPRVSFAILLVVKLHERAGMEEVTRQRLTVPALSGNVSNNRSGNLGKPTPDFLNARNRFSVVVSAVRSDCRCG